MSSTDLQLSGGIERAAVISDCGKYRYRLSRYWGMYGRDARTVLWIMLNPSTADAMQDDPTIRRCKTFADSWGYNSILVGNLYAFRATDPQVMYRTNDPVGPDNTAHLRAMSEEATITVLGWGANFVHPEVVQQTLVALKYRPVYCLGRTKSGAPRHPLYVSGMKAREEWNP